MLYQKMLTGDEPYFISGGKFINAFQIHRHPEAEFFYCIDGSFDIIIDREIYTLNKGDMALIAPMSAHELPRQDDKKAHHIVIEVGPSFLNRSFSFFSELRFKSPVVHIGQLLKSHRELAELWEETDCLNNNRSDFSNLFITGNVYKICGYILSEFTCQRDGITRNMKAVANIDKVLDMINTHYREQLSVDMAADLAGYGKSNFCKIFKAITGDTFHNVLNRHRIENACMYLSETDMTVADIGSEVGFSDTKSFCRVFKSIIGSTAGEYRRSGK